MVTIIGVGDIMPGGVLAGVNEGYVSQEVLEMLRKGDIRVGTLETAIGNSPTFNQEKMSRKGDMLTKGNDFLRSVDFTDTMILPPHFYWRESILQAIGQGRCYLTAEEHYENNRIFSVYTFHVEADGITYEPLVLRVTPFAREYISNPALKLDESGEKIVLSWTVHSRDTGREMDACTAIINLGENALLIDTDAVQEEVREAGRAKEYDLRNEIQAVQHYPYSNDQTQEASCSNIITIGESDYEISKTCSEQGARFGEDAAYTVLYQAGQYGNHVP